MSTVPERGRAQRVLLVGATGFIGRRIRSVLEEAGHTVIAAARRAAAGEMQVDLARDTDPSVWRSRVQGIDVVINAAGAFHDVPDNALAALHGAGPAALFEAAARQGVKRIIQVSALGTDS